MDNRGGSPFPKNLMPNSNILGKFSNSFSHFSKKIFQLDNKTAKNPETIYIKNYRENLCHNCACSFPMLLSDAHKLLLIYWNCLIIQDSLVIAGILWQKNKKTKYFQQFLICVPERPRMKIKDRLLRFTHNRFHWCCFSIVYKIVTILFNFNFVELRCLGIKYEVAVILRTRYFCDLSLFIEQRLEFIHEVIFIRFS